MTDPLEETRGLLRRAAAIRSGVSIEPDPTIDYASAITIAYRVADAEPEEPEDWVRGECSACREPVWLSKRSGAVFAANGSRVLCLVCYEAL